MTIDTMMHKAFIKNAGILMILALSLAALAGCAAKESPFAGREASDLSGYEGMEGSSEQVMLVDTDVAEIAGLMEGKQSFVLYAGFDTCPYCNRLLPYLNEVATEEGIHIGYLDTRRDPAWESNMDIDDYDTFIELFGEYLEEDEDGKLHLYTPDVYFIKDGKVAARHEGIVEGADDPEQELTEEQEKTLRKTLKEEFQKIR